MKKVLLTLLIACVFCGGVYANASEPKAILTIGDNSYFPINEGGAPADKPETILRALKYFQDTHPQLEVLSWNIEKQQRAYVISHYIYGIWIHHRPRQNK